MYNTEQAYEKFMKEIDCGRITYATSNELYLLMQEKYPGEKSALAEELYGVVGKGIYFDIYLYSYILKLSPQIKYLNAMLELIMNSDSLNWQQLYFLFYQITSCIFMNSVLNVYETVSMNWKLQQKALSMCAKELDLDLKHIPEEERNENIAVVITEQFLSVQHGPTKTALDRCYVLQKKLNKRVFLINTAELLPGIGEVPFYNRSCGNYLPELLDETTVSWQGETFQYYQCENVMPDIEEMTLLLNTIIRLKPSIVVCIGGSSLFAGLVNYMIPVLTVGTIQSGLATTLADYQVIDDNMIEHVKPLLKLMDKDMSHIIPGRFTFSLKNQTEHLKREDVGIDKDAFVMAVVGGRLDDEITDEFLNMLEMVISDNMLIAVIGKCDSFDNKLSRHPKLDGHMINMGFCRDILSRLELCDLYINPTRRGGGTSVVEAMSKGKPAVTVNYGDVAGIVGDTFSCKDYAEMGRLIKRYHSDKEFYEEQSKQALRMAEEYLDTENEFARIVHVYEDKIKGEKA